MHFATKFFATLQTFIPEVIMPKKGRLNKEEKAIESAPAFKRLKNKHSAIEPTLMMDQLDRCWNRTRISIATSGELTTTFTRSGVNSRLTV